MRILGLSFDFHDSAACLLVDGLIVAAAEEERFTRRKHDSAFPSRAIAYCLEQAKCDIADIDHVVHYEKPIVKFDRILETCLAAWPRTLGTWLRAMPVWLHSKLRVGTRVQTEIGFERDMLYCEHHLSHASSAYYPSPHEDACVLTMDGVGEWTTTSIGRGRGIDLAIERKLRFPHSIGLFFSALTAYLGFKVNDAEWKVMGLAPYGRPRFTDVLSRMVDMKPDGSFRLDMRYFSHHFSVRRSFSRAFEKALGRPARAPESALDEFHYDVARSGQEVVEKLVLNLAKAAYEMHPIPRLSLAGGVALNCVANWKIREHTPFKEVFIQPAAGDSGGALGAAFFVEHALLRRPRRSRMDHAFFGPAFDSAAIESVLTRAGAAFQRLDEASLVDRAARLLEEGKVIGWFQGRMEFGPRALGGRSILADPRDPATKERINSKVKFREWFRPFAPAVLKERAHEFFEMPAGLDLPFMLMVPRVREEWRERLPAVTHEDGTGRVQTLTAEANGRFRLLVERFGELTGIPIVVNTSFNVRGEPIVCTPEDAWRTFLVTGLDALVIGDYIVTEKPVLPDFESGMARSVALERSDGIED